MGAPMARPALPPPGASRFTTTLTVALATSAGVLAVVAVAAGRSGATGLAALASVGAMVTAAAGYVAWRSARRLETSMTAVAEALRALADGDTRSEAAPPPAPETADLVEGYRRLSDRYARLYGSVTEHEQARRTFRKAIAELGDVTRLRDRPAASADREKNLQVDRERILKVVCETAQLAVGGDRAVFYEFVPAPDRLIALSGPGAPVGAVLASGVGVAGAAAASREPVCAPGDAEPAPPEPERPTAMAVPFFSRRDLIGVVAVYGRASDSAAAGTPFQQDDLEALETLVAQAGTAVDNVSLHEEAQRLSITDGLTGLWNRRQLELRCREELDRAIRFGRPVGVVFLDIDRFKLINDDPEWLHPGGDTVLVEVAQRISSVTREIDVVARYGGEEFVLLLPETDLAGSLVLAEKVRQTVSETPIEYGGQARTVTVSLGVASYPHSGTNVRTLLKAADAALHRAKSGGRNRIEQAEPKIRGTGTGG